MTHAITHDGGGESIDHLCQEILAFLAERPRMRDTLEGIASWWILQRDIRRETERVRAAVLKLVDDGDLEEIRGPNGRLHYRLPRVAAAPDETEASDG